MQRDEYRVLYTYLRNWHKDVRHERDVCERKLCRDFILILANTGMRFGEARRIKWNFVEIKKSPSSKYPNVHIRVPAELSKVRKDRTAIGMRGDIFQRIKTYSNHTHPQDFVFADYDTGEAVSRKELSIVCGISLEKRAASQNFQGIILIILCDIQTTIWKC